MYSLGGVSLENPGNGWTIQWASEPDAGIEEVRASVIIPGVSGVPSMPGRTETRLVSLMVRTGDAGREALVALVRAGGQLVKQSSGAVLPVEYMSITPEKLRTWPAVTWDMLCVFRMVGDVAWRDPADSTSTAVALASASQGVDVLPGLSMPVRDAVVRVKGAATGIQVSDSSGCWVTYGAALPAGSFWRFEAATGRAFTTTTDTWAGGVEVTGLCDWSDPAYPFSIFPAFTNPTARTGRVTVATSSRSGAAVEVRGRRAFAFG